MKTVTIREAKKRLTELARREVGRGRDDCGGRGRACPRAISARYRPPKGLRPEAVGELQAQTHGIETIAPFIADDFDEPLPEDFSCVLLASRRMRLLLDTHILLRLCGAWRGWPAGRRCGVAETRSLPLIPSP